MPPVLNVAFAELSARAQQKLRPKKLRFGVDERHGVLQLVAETKSAARLVVTAARPHTAGERLVDEPAVREHIREPRPASRPARRPRYAASSSATSSSALRAALAPRKRSSSDLTSSSFPHDLRPATPSAENDLAHLPVGKSKGTCRAAQGSKPAPRRFDRCARSIAAGRSSEPLRPMNSLRSPVTVRAAPATSKKATRAGEFGVVAIARANRAAGRVDLGDDVHCGFRAHRRAPIRHTPLRKPGAAARRLAQTQHRELDRGVHCHVHGKLRGDAGFAVLEDV